MANSFAVANAGRTIERKNSGSIPAPSHAASACLRAEMAAARLARSPRGLAWVTIDAGVATHAVALCDCTTAVRHTHGVDVLLCDWRLELSACALEAARALRAFTAAAPALF